METKEAIENNKMIAEFLGYKINNAKYMVFEPSTIVGQYSVDRLFFNTSWDWLMPVINRITCLGIDHNEDLFMKIGNSFNSINIDNTYKHVVNYVKWYNENKPANV